MKLQQWRERGEDVTLPSGLEVKMRRVKLLDLAVLGDGIPAPLVDTLNQMMGGEGSKNKTDGRFSAFAAELPMFNAVAKVAIVEPLVADEADEEHLGVEELSVEDRLFVFNWNFERAGGVALEPFREEPEGAVDLSQLGGDVRDETEHNPEDQGSMDGVSGRSVLYGGGEKGGAAADEGEISGRDIGGDEVTVTE